MLYSPGMAAVGLKNIGCYRVGREVSAGETAVISQNGSKPFVKGYTYTTLAIKWIVNMVLQKHSDNAM